MRAPIISHEPTLTALLAVVLFACSEPVPTVPDVTRPVKIYEVGGEDLDVRRDYPGTITSDAEARIAFEVPGRLIEFPVDEGQEVDEGTLLARIDAQDFKATQEKAGARMENLRADLDRSQELSDQGILSTAELDRRRTAFLVAKAEFRTAQKAVNDATLRARAPGRIARKLARVGESIRAKSPVLVFQQDSPNGTMEIEISVPEREIAKAAPDLTNEAVTNLVKPLVRLRTVADRSIPAQISEVATSPDLSTRTFQVTLQFKPPSDLLVLPGMTATVSIRSPDLIDGLHGFPDGLAIPSTAVVSDEAAAPFVWRIEPETMTVSRTAVEIGPLVRHLITIRSGLDVGDWIALSGVHQLTDGTEVSRLED